MNADRSQQAVYDAEELWLEEADMLGLFDPDEPKMDPENVLDFIDSVLRRAEWPQDPPTVVFDVQDDDDFSGKVTAADEVIHLHPRLLSRPTVLHEVAHWLDLREGHGPIFQGNLLTLIDAEFGTEAAVLLYDCLTEQGLVPDPWRLPESMPLIERLRTEALERSRFTQSEEGVG